MNILQLNFERGWRGGERQTLLSMQSFRDDGHKVAVLAREGGELAHRAREAGFKVHAFASVPAACFFLAVQGRSFDILHAQTANTLSWLALLKPVLGRRIVFTRRTAFPVPPARQARTVWKWTRADALVAISQAAAAEPRRLGLAPRIIPSAIAPRVLNQERGLAFARAHIPPGRRVLATVAALTPEKDPCTLVRAVQALRRVRDDFVFVHLGAPGAASEAAHALVAELGLQDHYRFAGFQTDVEDFYPLMDVFVSGSRFEALGTSVLDAFLYGVPVVSTDAGGLAESLADGRGIVCPVGDAQALADGIARVLDDTALRTGIVERARAYVQAEHDVPVMAGRYLDVYRQVAGSG